jgi:hypothetical protein
MTKETNKMNKKTDGLGNNAKRNEALTRIANLEGAIQQLVPALDRSFTNAAKEANELSKNITALDQVVNALIEVLQKQTDVSCLMHHVKEQVKTNKIAQLEAESEAYVANLKVALAEGKVIPTETAKNDDDILVISQVNDKGETLHPSKAFITLAQFNPGVKELVTDKKAGEVVTLPTGGSITILEIYSVVPQKEAEQKAE